MTKTQIVGYLLILALFSLGGIGCGDDETGSGPTSVNPDAIEDDDVEKSAPDNAVAGSVAISGPASLPPDAVLEVRLVDVTWIDAPSVAIATQTIRNLDKLSVDFRVEYDPSEIDQRSRYAIEGRITVDGELAFWNDTAYEVIADGKPTRVDMTLKPAR